MKEYDHKKLEKKWQTIWEKKKIYQAKDLSKKPKFYGLIEFPYPSGAGLHVGHIRSNTAMDIISRKRRMEGYNVLYPIGWDAFGLPTENFAIKSGIHPIKVTKQNTDTFRKQLKALGFSFDWSREINTTDPKYYKWTQWIFLQLFNKDLAYKAKTEINWCPSCKIGLANEEVVGGMCERCGGPTEKREKEQWMLAITKYADRLDSDLDTVDYLPKIKIQQRNWIGRSEGTEIEFKINLPLAPSKGRGITGEFGYHTTDAKTWKALQDRVLEMRKNPTIAEDKLWQSLRKNLTGSHFRRQHIIGNFIVDFVCLEKSLIIEVDGDIHDYKKKEDNERTEFLKQSGFKVLRFNNKQVLNNVHAVMKKVNAELEALPFGEGLGGVSSVKVFTTRPDTIFGATFLALAPEVVKKVTGKDFGVKIDTNRENKEKIGVDTGLKAKNPANGETIPVFVVNYVSAEYGTGAIMGVPAHDERDFQFAKKYDLPIRQVIAPFSLSPNSPPRKEMPMISRHVTASIVRNPKNNKYLCLQWKVRKEWRTFVTGGIEKEEDPVVAASREIIEETGYKNFKFIKILRLEAHEEFYHLVKKENRHAAFHCLVYDLVDESKDEIGKEEKELHELVWVDEDKVQEFVEPDVFKFFWSQYKKGESAYEGDGILINSGKFDGMDSEKAKKEIIKFIGGKEKTTFKLRDWIFSRQRYWGEPIPVIFCDKCGAVPVPEKDLPVELPKVKNYQPTDSGESPLANISKWVNVKCPKCKGPAKRETDTMPNWAGSSWYYLRYADPKNKKEFASKKNLNYWVPNGVDWYNGGMEHTTLHLLYSRFWHKFLYDLKLVPTSEPYMKRTSHGMILAKTGDKMSKSKGNTVNPDDLIKTYGADTLRLYEMFIGPFDQSVSWNTDSMIGPRRFLERVWNLAKFCNKNSKRRGSPVLMSPRAKAQEFLITERSLLKLLHHTIKKVSEDIEDMKFNTAISTMMIFINEVGKFDAILQDAYENFLKLLSPFAPHLTEELWKILGHKDSIHLSKWPKYDPQILKDDEIKIVVQINGKVRAEMMIGAEQSEENVKKQALDDATIKKHTEGKEIKRTIYVKGRLVNIVL